MRSLAHYRLQIIAGMEGHDTVLRGAIVAPGIDTTALIGIGRGTERGRGVPEKGIIIERGRGAGAGGGMKSIEGQKSENIMMKGTERETGRGQEILRGKENERGKGSQEHLKQG